MGVDLTKTQTTCHLVKAEGVQGEVLENALRVLRALCGEAF